MNAFLQKYGIAIFVLVVVGVMVALASPLGNMIKDTVSNEITKFTDKEVADYENGGSGGSCETGGEQGGNTVTYSSLGNWEHKLSNGTVEAHDTTNGTCSKCGEAVLETGVYSEDNIKIIDFWELVYNSDTEPPVGEENQGMTHPSKSYPYLYSNGILSTHNGIAPGTSAVTNLCGKLVLDNSIVEIGPEAFYECVNLTSIILPKNLEVIKNLTFAMCSNLKTISISSNVTSIESAAFGLCEKLTDINYYGTKEQWNKISLYEGDIDWNLGCPEITVHCIDGDIIILANPFN